MTAELDFCPFGVRQCFALPLWFFVFLSLFFRTAQEHQEKPEKPKRQCFALPHSKKRQTGKGSGCGNSAVIFATPQGNTRVAKVSNPCFTYRFLHNRLTQKGQKSS
jgi:hypothetical protein